MSLIVAEYDRGKTLSLVLKDADGGTITPGESDRVRVRIGREGEADKLSLTSGSDSKAGSSITKGAANTVRLDATDLRFAPGVYTMWVEYYDAADAAEWKCVQTQVFWLQPTS